jgi:hypothetical protein
MRALKLWTRIVADLPDELADVFPVELAAMEQARAAALRAAAEEIRTSEA